MWNKLLIWRFTSCQSLHCESLISSSGRFSTVQKGAYVKYLPMPRLSPSMESGAIKKWFIQPNDYVQSYQLVLEVVAKQVRKTSSPETKYTMEIELLEDMYVAELLANEGEECAVGQPIAVFCDYKEDIENVRSHPVSALFFVVVLFF
jgi:hypothetical protein